MWQGDNAILNKLLLYLNPTFQHNLKSDL